MKKKILIASLAVIMIVTAIAGASLAYLQDTDHDKNTMTVGNVKIVQNETDRNGDAFVEGQKLLPAVYNELTKDLTITDTNGKSIDVWGDSINNEIDKFVSVTNNGTESAYIRTIFAFETQRHYAAGTDEVVADLQDVYIGFNGSFDYLNRYIVVNGVEYALASYTYKGLNGDGVIPAGATTESSLRQIFLAPTAGNEFYDFIGEEYDILALSQAVQTAGFDSADQALNAAFGDLATIEDSVLIGWFNEVN